MNYLWEGIKVGLILSMLAGPLFVTLVQTGVEKGFRAGMTVGLGIWISDALFVLAVYFGLAFVAGLVDGHLFKQVLGLAGGTILIAFGWVALLSKPLTSVSNQPWKRNTSTWLALGLKGFLINTVNPFTFFFWVGIAGHVVVADNLSQAQSFDYFAGILGTIITTDTLKVAMARRIRLWLSPKHLNWMRRIAGIGLILFGILLIARVFA